MGESKWGGSGEGVLVIKGFVCLRITEDWVKVFP